MSGGGGGGGGRNQRLVNSPQLDRFKNEMAQEIGIPNYGNIDKGALPSRANGAVGGNMVRRMIQMAEASISATPPQR